MNIRIYWGRSRPITYKKMHGLTMGRGGVSKVKFRVTNHVSRVQDTNILFYLQR